MEQSNKPYESITSCQIDSLVCPKQEATFSVKCHSPLSHTPYHGAPCLPDELLWLWVHGGGIYKQIEDGKPSPSFLHEELQKIANDDNGWTTKTDKITNGANKNDWK